MIKTNSVEWDDFYQVSPPSPGWTELINWRHGSTATVNVAECCDGSWYALRPRIADWGDESWDGHVMGRERTDWSDWANSTLPSRPVIIDQSKTKAGWTQGLCVGKYNKWCCSLFSTWKDFLLNITFNRLVNRKVNCIWPYKYYWDR